MRLLVVLTFLVCIYPAFPSGGRLEHFSVKISLLEGEHSKDSHSSTTSIVLNSNRLTYQKR
jgi:hypothetical protein